MNVIIGIVLFVIGTLGAFIAATAVIAYLKTFSVFMRLKKWCQWLFNVAVIAIAALVSMMIAQMLVPDETAETVEVVADATSEDLEEMPRDEKAPVEVAETENYERTEPNAVEESENAVGSDAATEPETTSAVPVSRSALAPSFSVWTNVYKGKEYAYVEIENGLPYVYAPNARGSFWYDLNNISSGRESGNIVVMANAGLFNDDSNPVGAAVQNGKILIVGSDAKVANTLVVDEDGNVGYTNKAIAANGTVEYTDALTGEKVSGRKIVSAVTGFSPVVVNGKVATEYKNKVGTNVNTRARSIFCVRGKGSYTLITNKGEGVDGGGWNFDDMATVALRRGCQFAFNMDGGGSTALAWRTSVNVSFSTYVTTERHNPTFIVFTADNLAPSGK